MCKNALNVWDIVYKICMETNTQWCVAHMGKQMAKGLFLKSGLLLTKCRTGKV